MDEERVYGDDGEQLSKEEIAREKMAKEVKRGAVVCGAGIGVMLVAVLAQPVVGVNFATGVAVGTVTILMLFAWCKIYRRFIKGKNLDMFVHKGIFMIKGIFTIIGVIILVLQDVIPQDVAIGITIGAGFVLIVFVLSRPHSFSTNTEERIKSPAEEYPPREKYFSNEDIFLTRGTKQTHQKACARLMVLKSALLSNIICTKYNTILF